MDEDGVLAESAARGLHIDVPAAAAESDPPDDEHDELSPASPGVPESDALLAEAVRAPEAMMISAQDELTDKGLATTAAQGLPEDVESAVRSAFTRFDVSGEGWIAGYEAGAALAAAGIADCPPVEELGALIAAVAPDNVDRLKYPQFVQLVQYLMYRTSNAQQPSPSEVAARPDERQHSPGYSSSSSSIIGAGIAAKVRVARLQKIPAFPEFNPVVLEHLRMHEEERVRAEMRARHEREVLEVQNAHRNEQMDHQKMWDAKEMEFQESARHESKVRSFYDASLSRSPTRAQCSSDLLNARAIQSHLAKQSMYLRAQHVKAMADRREREELHDNREKHEAETTRRVERMRERQAVEQQALLQRGARGREEMRRMRSAHEARQMQRFKNLVAELATLHCMEAAQLGFFLEKQTVAGKRPLPDLVDDQEKVKTELRKPGLDRFSQSFNMDTATDVSPIPSPNHAPKAHSFQL
eukprot:jgi/Chlat1/5760/Chrsp387S00425